MNKLFTFMFKFFMYYRQINYNIELFNSTLKYSFQRLNMFAIISLCHEIYHYKITVFHC